MPFADDEDRPFDIYNVVLYDFAGLPNYYGFEDGFKVLTQFLLHHQPANRPTFQELAEDSFLRGGRSIPQSHG